MDQAHANVALLTLACVGCGAPSGESNEPLRAIIPGLFATEVITFEPGEGAGYGQDQFPEIVLGAPLPLGEEGASLDVLSLGVGGEIVLGFGEHRIIDRAGPDLAVFENPFLIDEDPMNPFAELGAVAVSDDGLTWHEFECDPAGSGDGRWPGCAGWSPSRSFDPQIGRLDPETSGGDMFDLADVGLVQARYVRIRDLSDEGEPTSAGFDLDAVGLFSSAPLQN